MNRPAPFRWNVYGEKARWWERFIPSRFRRRRDFTITQGRLVIKESGVSKPFVFVKEELYTLRLAEAQMVEWQNKDDPTRW